MFNNFRFIRKTGRLDGFSKRKPCLSPASCKTSRVSQNALAVTILFLCMSCVHSRTGGSSLTIRSSVKIKYGNAIVKIGGKITEDLYLDNIFSSQAENKKYVNDPPSYTKDTITKNETKYLSTGDEYTFSVLPAEVVTINIVSRDGNDVEIIGYERGKETVYTLKGTNKLGILIAFQNR